MCVSGCSAANILKEKIQTNGPILVSSTWVLAFMRMSLTRLNSVFGQHTPSSVPLDRTMYTPALPNVLMNSSRNMTQIQRNWSGLQTALISVQSFKMLILTLFFHTTYTLSITRTKSHPKFNRIRWRTLGNYTISHGLYYEMLLHISALFWNKHSWHYWLFLTYTRFITG